MANVKAYCITVLCFLSATVFAQVRSVKNEALPDKINFSDAAVVAAPGLSGPENKAVEMLVDEVEKRSRVHLPVVQQASVTGKKIFIGQHVALTKAFPFLEKLLGAAVSSKPEGYRIVTGEPGLVIVAGNDARGVLFGAGKLLRMMDYLRDTVLIPAKIDIVAAPRYPLRGHQLGYRPKTNSYDGWSVSMWEQYIRDLVVFGTNAIELIPPVSDDDDDSPHFQKPPMNMMIEMSRLAKAYGIECWVWYPAIEKDYSDKATVNKALKDWSEVLRQLPRVDALFVPGGDPGHTAPKTLFALLEKQTAQLQQLHPGAKMWMSPQGFNASWMSEFYSLMQQEPAWLEGIVFGPQQSESLDDLRAKLPARFKLRFYPDITHCLRAQYPVQDWDFAYSVTLNREPVNPRPVDQSLIFRRLQPVAAHGFLTYSEGCNDDVNKLVWSALGWDQDMDITDILRDYSRYFIGTDVGESFARGLLSLEQNWRGSLLHNQQVETTLLQFQEMERSASPQRLQNWRFQEALYRAYYDATVRSRLLQETAQEERAMAFLRQALLTGSEAALKNAEAAFAAPASPSWTLLRSRVFELAEALFQSIHMQLSVPKYQAIATHRGANLDLIDYPLNNAGWLRKQFAGIRAIPEEPDRLKKIEAILNWTNPGAGGFYDDLGNPAAQPHLVRGTGYAEDPAFLKAPMTGFSFKLKDPSTRISSGTFAETLHEHPLQMFYSDLDTTAKYRIRVVYGAEANSNIRMVANDVYEIHPMMAKNMDSEPLEFNIPEAATKNGSLKLQWSRPPGLGRSGRGAQVAEVWLMRVHDIPTHERKQPYLH
jgi:hypothetical protein